MATLNIQSQSDLNYVREKWGWFMFLGATMLLAGMVALICTTTTTVLTVMLLGWVLVISGGTHLIESFAVRSWSGFLLHLIMAIFQTMVGFVVIGAPAANAVLITYMFAIFLMVSGIFRLIAGLGLPIVGGLVAFSGFTSFILGLMIFREWPDSSLWFIGLFVAIDLIMHGLSWITFALQARGLPRGSDPALTPAAA